MIDGDGLAKETVLELELEGLSPGELSAAAGFVAGDGAATAAAAWLDLEPRSLAQLNLRPQLPFLDFVPVVVDDEDVGEELELPLPLMLLLLLAWLAQLELRQHLHTRDFLPDDVSELSSVAAVDVADGVIVLVVVVVVSSGCRQQDEEDTEVVAITVVAPAADAALVAAGDGAVTVFVDSFVLLPWVVFNIFSSHSPVELCRTDAIAQRGHSPALNGCSSLL